MNRPEPNKRESYWLGRYTWFMLILWTVIVDSLSALERVSTIYRCYGCEAIYSVTASDKSPDLLAPYRLAY